MPALLLAGVRSSQGAPSATRLVFDAHVHVVDRQFYHGGDMGQRVDDGQFDLVRAKEGGLDAMFF